MGYDAGCGGTINSFSAQQSFDPDTKHLDRFQLAENHLYGGSRLGLEKRNELLVNKKFDAIIDVNGPALFTAWVDQGNVPITTSGTLTGFLGMKTFELSNHLGNVLATLSDRKVAVDDGLGDIAYFGADVLSFSDYYPFGMQMPGRNGGIFYFGFNGQEIDLELYGDYNAIAFDLRVYDTRIGRFLSMDPIAISFASWSPYLFAANNPVKLIDIFGAGPYNPGEEEKKRAQLRVSTARQYDKQFTYARVRPYNPNDKQKDCTSFVTFILQKTDPALAKKITNNYMNVQSTQMINRIKGMGGTFRKDNPQVGDLAVWTGHFEFVSYVDGNKFTVYGSRKGVIPNEMGVNSKGYYWLHTGYNVSILGSGTWLGFWTPPILGESGELPTQSETAVASESKVVEEPDESKIYGTVKLDMLHLKLNVAGNPTPYICENSTPCLPEAPVNREIVTRQVNYIPGPEPEWTGNLKERILLEYSKTRNNLRTK